MQLGGYAARRYTVIRYVVLSFAAIRHLGVGYFHILCLLELLDAARHTQLIGHAYRICT